ncbi:hypothetical protein POSPLADRAFT_1081796, partial [Postia placenta MAD-698-R-SB12]
CRTGHCFTGEYYRFFVPAEPDDCPCGLHRQTRAHILQDCPRYAPHRHILRGVSTTIDLPTILGTEKGIAALAVFIARSGAFTKSGAPRPARPAARLEELEEAPAADDDSVEAAGVVGEVPSSDDEDDE